MKTILRFTASLFLVAITCVYASGQSGTERGDTVKLWNLENGQQVGKLSDAAVDVTSIAFSPDGGTIAAGSSSGSVVLWNARTGKQGPTLAGSSASVTSVAFSPDGELLASGSLDGTVILWKISTATLERKLERHSDAVLSVAFTADGTLLATGSLDGTAKLWDVKSGRERMTLMGHTGGVEIVCLSANGRFLASAGMDDTIRIWEIATGREVRMFRGRSAGISSMVVSPDAKLLITGGAKDYTIRVWDMETGIVVRTLRGHVSSVDSLALSADGKTLASGSLDQTVTFWDLASGKELRNFEGHSHNVTALAFSPDGKTLATGSALDLPKKPNLYVLSVGIDQYREAKLSLEYSVADTESLTQAFKRGAEQSSTYDRVKTRVLFNSAATSNAIEDALNEIVNAAQPQDTFVFFYEGHGAFAKSNNDTAGDLCLVTSDVTGIGNIEERGLPVKRLRVWTSRIQARNQMLILDLVRSESAIQGLSSYATKVIDENAAFREFVGDNKVVLTGIESLQTALEQSAQRHGLMAYSLLEGFEGRADSNRDGIITARELAEFAVARENELSSASSEKIAFSNTGTYTSGLDFPLALAPNRRTKGLESTPQFEVSVVKRSHTPGHNKPQEPRRRSEPVDEPDRTKTASASPLKAKNYAVLFATNDYDKDSGLQHLNNPIRDAESLAVELHDLYGFEAKVYRNLPLEKILAVLKEYETIQYGPEDQLLIFFAGHGVYDRPLGYLATSSSKSKKDDPFHLSYLEYARLVPTINSFNCKHIVLIADACKAGAIKRSSSDPDNRAGAIEEPFDWRLAGNPAAAFIRKKLRVTTRQWLTSGSELDYVYDGTDHSPFARALLKALQKKSDDGFLQIENIIFDLRLVPPLPVSGHFGDDIEGSTFFFIPVK